jgi:hypothetical protein
MKCWRMTVLVKRLTYKTRCGQIHRDENYAIKEANFLKSRRRAQSIACDCAKAEARVGPADREGLS